MARFAKLNDKNEVITVVAVNDDVADLESDGQEFLKKLYKEPNAVWKKCSYNTHANVHYTETEQGYLPSEDQSKAYRKNFPNGAGFIYDEARDAFIEPKPYPSWVLDETTCCYKAPVDKPSGLNENNLPWQWDEDSTSWI